MSRVCLSLDICAVDVDGWTRGYGTVKETTFSKRARALSERLSLVLCHWASS